MSQLKLNFSSELKTVASTYQFLQIELHVPVIPTSIPKMVNCLKVLWSPRTVIVITAVTCLSIQDIISFYWKIPVVLQQVVNHTNPRHLYGWHDCFYKVFPDSRASQGRKQLSFKSQS